MKYTIQEITEMVGVRGAQLNAPEADVSQLLTDSRSLVMPAETLFFALPTAKILEGNDISTASTTRACAVL